MENGGFNIAHIKMCVLNNFDLRLVMLWEDRVDLRFTCIGTAQIHVLFMVLLVEQEVLGIITQELIRQNLILFVITLIVVKRLYVESKLCLTTNVSISLSAY